MSNVTSLRITRVEERRVAKTRLIEMILDEEWSGLLDSVAELRRALPQTASITERWGDWTHIKGHVDRSVMLALANVDAPVPDGLEDAAVTHHYGRSGGTQMSVAGVDAEQRVIELGNVTGDSVYYRWHARSDGGFRFEQVDGEGNPL